MTRYSCSETILSNMEIVAVVNVHKPDPVVHDSLEAISRYVTDKIVTVIDGASAENFDDFSLPVARVNGFYHNYPKAPYRNVALGLMMAIDHFPQFDWLLYTEYDLLFASDRFKKNLEMAEKSGVWMLGNDGRVDYQNMSFVEGILGETFRSQYYLLGCCLFFHKDFIRKLLEVDFFEKFLHATNGFDPGVIPFYEGYDISEHLYSTLARHWGGNIGVFATWDGLQWHGASKYFPFRWQPELESDGPYQDASILHPLKSYDHPLREFFRKKRREELHVE